MSVERNKKFMRELKKECTKNKKIHRHISKMELMIIWTELKEIINKKNRKTYYFRKQIEVAKRKLKKS